MIITKINTELIKIQVKEHKKYKKQLLKLINEMPNNAYEWISKSDWDLPSTFERTYLNLFYKDVIRSSMKKLQDYFKAKDWSISNTWFQQYKKNSYHQWHNHEHTNWTNVYFLELPNKRYTTKILIDNKILNYEAKEGDLICFPGYLPHTSGKNKGKRKTVISFNSNFKY